MDDFDQFFGYDKPKSSEELPFLLPDYDPVCMVIKVTRGNIKDLIRETGKDLKRNQYLLSVGSCSSIQVYGPFKIIDDAFDMGKEKAGAIRFKAPPSFNI